MELPWHVLVVLVGVLTLCSSQNDDDRIGSVGHDIIETDAAPSWNKTTFLLNTVALRDGVLFAFSGYYVNRRPVYFQIWRPVENTNAEFTLIAEWYFLPTKGGQAEDMYIHTMQGYKCVYVKESDRLGIYTDTTPSAVGYLFVPGEAVYFHNFDIGESRDIGVTIEFNSLAFPYKFSAKAYIDTETSRYADLDNPTCPDDLIIPHGETTQRPTQVPLTSRPGATGATGPDGPKGPNGATGATGPTGIIGATGPPGQAGTDGSPGMTGLPGQPGTDGATGSTGPAGPSGSPGPKGDKGEPGKTITIQQSRLEEEYGDCDWCWEFMSPYFILGGLLWLVILTIILIVLIAVIACRRSQPQYDRNMPWTQSQNDLWKHYDDQNKMGFENNGFAVTAGEPVYSYVEEGRTAF